MIVIVISASILALVAVTFISGFGTICADEPTQSQVDGTSRPSISTAF